MSSVYLTTHSPTKTLNDQDYTSHRKNHNMSIISNISNNPRNFSTLSEYQSSNALQNSIKAYSIPKEERFRNFYKKGIDNFYQVENKIINKGTSFGFGNKTDMTSLKHNTPSPANYNIPSFLSKQFITLKFKHENHKQAKDKLLPGPANYNPTLPKDNIIATMKFRHGFFYDDDLKAKKYQISPQTYLPSSDLVFSSRYKNLKFSTSVRENINSTKDIKSKPGPGSYNLPSVFDLTRKNKPAIN